MTGSRWALPVDPAATASDGASWGNPKGRAGYAFRITVGEHEAGLISSLVQPFSHGTELIRGYGYGGMDRTTNEMEYTGLLEGLIWALRLDPKHVNICGDSKLVLRQVFEQSPVEDSKLATLHAKVTALMDEKPKDTIITYSHVLIEWLNSTVCIGMWIILCGSTATMATRCFDFVRIICFRISGRSIVVVW